MPLVSSAQSALNVSWNWKRAHECNATSPEISIAGVPADAKTLEVKMVDLNFRQFDHGGGAVAASGDSTVVVPSGALKNYRGPCPGRNIYFGNDYEFTVIALAADGKTVLAQGSAVRTYGRSVVKD
jgi:phosphatidylethanolamine-binding protein (PEBP) family uncharacterized protein